VRSPNIYWAIRVSVRKRNLRGPRAVDVRKAVDRRPDPPQPRKSQTLEPDLTMTARHPTSHIDRAASTSWTGSPPPARWWTISEPRTASNERGHSIFGSPSRREGEPKRTRGDFGLAEAATEGVDGDVGLYYREYTDKRRNW